MMLNWFIVVLNDDADGIEYNNGSRIDQNIAS